MKFLLFSLLLFPLTVFSESSSDINARIDRVEKEIEVIEKRIKGGHDPALYKKALSNFKQELAELQNQKKAFKASPPKKEAADKPVVQKRAKRSGTITTDEIKKIKNEIKELSKSHELLKQQLMSSSKSEKVDPIVKTNSFKYNGHLQLRSEMAENQTGIQDRHQSLQTFFRLRTYLTFEANDKMTLYLTPQAAKTMGGDSNGAETSGSTNHPDLQFFEANVNYKFAESFAMKIGRQEMAYGDHLIIGSLGWANTGRSFDALRFRKSYEKGWTDLFYSKISDNSTTDSASDDVNLNGVYHSQSFNAYLNPLDLYFIHQRDSKVTEVEVNTFGIRIKGEHNGINYRTENGVQNGASLGDDAFQTETEVGYVFHKHAFAAQYALAGKNYRQLYPTAHKFLGIADVLGRRNIEEIAVKYSYPILTKLNINASFHKFNRHNTNAPAYRLNGTTSWGNTGDDKHIGNEVDLVANYTTAGNLTFQLGAALFSPGDYMKAQSADQAKETQFVYLQLFAPF